MGSFKNVILETDFLNKLGLNGSILVTFKTESAIPTGNNFHLFRLTQIDKVFTPKADLTVKQ